MTQQYYGDAMANYLIILCPKEALEGYQYRMLAVNRIRGLLPCSLRTIDGETFLYYEITSRQSLARRYEQRRISGEELKKILYSVTEMLKSLSEYLLDETHLFMDPEYIFYDVETEGYWFTYYPEQRDPESVERFLGYLAEKTDPDAAEAAAVIYRLCDLASNPGFILREEILDSEYEQASLRGFQSGPPPREGKGQLPPDRNPDLRRNHSAGPEYGVDPEEEDLPEREETERRTQGRRKRGQSATSNTGNQRAGSGKAGKPAGLLITAAVLLVAAAGLGAAGYLMPVNAAQLLAMRAGMIACLLLSILVAIYGTIYTWIRNRKEEQEDRHQKEEERRSAMMPSTEYNAATTGKT